MRTTTLITILTAIAFAIVGCGGDAAPDPGVAPDDAVTSTSAVTTPLTEPTGPTEIAGEVTPAIPAAPDYRVSRTADGSVKWYEYLTPRVPRTADGTERWLRSL